MQTPRDRNGASGGRWGAARPVKQLAVNSPAKSGLFQLNPLTLHEIPWYPMISRFSVRVVGLFSRKRQTFSGGEAHPLPPDP
jgi:hypothetical protein